ncbi:MAG: hypothetical protein M3436_16420 [Pseudomonadota bacterium]|nr:hypothetical protein [Pseudomonadota bacterium]
MPLRESLTQHEVSTTYERGWSKLGELLDAAEQDGFEVFVTTDKNLRHQQNLGARRIATCCFDLDKLAPHTERYSGCGSRAMVLLQEAMRRFRSFERLI